MECAHNILRILCRELRNGSRGSCLTFAVSLTVIESERKKEKSIRSGLYCAKVGFARWACTTYMLYQFDMRSVISMLLASLNLGSLFLEHWIGFHWSPTARVWPERLEVLLEWRWCRVFQEEKVFIPTPVRSWRERYAYVILWDTADPGKTILTYISSIACLPVLFKDEMRREKGVEGREEQRIKKWIGHRNPGAPPPDHVRRSCAAATWLLWTHPTDHSKRRRSTSYTPLLRKRPSIGIAHNSDTLMKISITPTEEAYGKRS